MASNADLTLPLLSSRTDPALSITSSSPSHSVVSLTKRLLFPYLPPSSPIPPLLQTSSTYPALDAELYDLIALALRAYINPWWTKITRYDKQLLVEITRILSSVLRALEERVLATDISSLIYHDLPVLLTQHCIDYRIAAQKLGSSYAAAGSASLPLLFHGQQQHAALSVDGKLDEVYVRAAVDIILKACLSPEDWDAEAERYLIREIIVKTVCMDIAPRVTQPWFLHSTLLNLLGPAEELLRLPDPPSRFNTNSFAFPSFHTIIVIFLSAVQTVSSTALSIIQIYKRTVNTIKDMPPASPSFRETPPTPRLPSPSDSVASHSNNLGTPPHMPKLASASPHNLARPLLLLVAELLSLRSRFSGTALLFLCDALISIFAPFLDRLLPLFLYTSILTPVQVTGLVSTAKHALFPNGYSAQSPPDPTLDEQAVLRSELVRRLAQTVPGPLAPLLLGSTPAMREQTLNALLEPFDEQACNAHLFVLTFDLVLLALFPEMAVGAADSGVSSL
ncbi:PXA domain-containing protein [Multifurca ochricompacta]|uniref:PXA domain-containing protein n=1 Tax=Multifurca ochricompacta TaxID=376703 RepID=A0AAD4MCY3_9AGAM|nr:PXA domain-containing protein [Multifurca ochricompacta]